MAEPIDPRLNMDGPLDVVQAAGLATDALDRELAKRTRALSAELDALYPALVDLVRRLEAGIAAVATCVDDSLLDLEAAVLRGEDDSATWPTVRLATQLVEKWTGADGLRARTLRAAHLLTTAGGVEIDPDDTAWVAGVLAEEAGR